MATITPTKKNIPATKHQYPLITPRERLLIWEKARGMWKNRKPDPIKELSEMRREWERKLPPLR